jgi:hypothetical protein
MKKPLFADFLLALMLLLTAEVGVRLFLPQDISGRFSYGFDQEAGYVESGDGKVHLVRAGGRRFRPQTFSRKRPADTFRIMVIGDSVPRGPSLKSAYAYQLQEILRDRGVKAEVINLGVPGFGARRKQLVLQKVLQYDPSLIILHLNDSNEYEDEREYRRSLEFKSWHPRHWLMKIFILARAYEIKTEKVFWRLLPEKIRELTAVNDIDAKVVASMDKAQELFWRDRVRQTTTEAVALARERGIPILLVTQLTLEPNGAGGIDLADHDLDAVAHSLEGEGVYVLSMKQIFSRVTSAQAYFSDFSHHLTPDGHKLMAKNLADLISCQLLEKVETPERGEREK